MPVWREELEGSPNLSGNRGEQTATQTFHIADADLAAFLLEVWPAPYISGNQVIIPPAATFPLGLGLYSWLIADSYQAAPFQPDYPSGFNELPNAYPTGLKVTINFKTQEFVQADGDISGPGGQLIKFMKYKGSIGGEFLLYPSAAIGWQLPSDQSIIGNANTPETPQDTAAGKDLQASVIVPTIQHHITWIQVPFPPWLAIRQCMGKVNAMAFSGAPPETLLFLGCDFEPDITVNGLRTWKLEYKFVEKNQNAADPANPQGWNYFLRPTGPSAGKFMRLRKKPPSMGFTRTATDGHNGDTFIDVDSANSFPRGGGFKVSIATETAIQTVTETDGKRRWTIAPGLTNTLVKAGSAVSQYMRTTVSGGINATQTTIPVSDTAGFPPDGGFYITMDSEIMYVVSVIQGAPGYFIVVRGAQGTAAAAHGGGVNMDPVGSSIYDVADFRTLFLSGFVTGP